MIKVDSSSLIYLTKLNLFDKFEESYKEIIISPSVKKEVIEDGLNKNKADAIIINQYYLNNKIRIHVPKKIIKDLNLGKGETEIISLSLEEDCPCILDDIKAQKIGIRLNAKIKSTKIILLELLKNGDIDKKSYENYIENYAKLVNLSQNEVWFYKQLGDLIK